MGSSSTNTDAEETAERVRGLLQVIEIGGMALGRAEYEPGWLWSRDVAGDETGETLCQASHVGIVLQGENKVTMADGTVRLHPPARGRAVPRRDVAL